MKFQRTFPVGRGWYPLASFEAVRKRRIPLVSDQQAFFACGFAGRTYDLW